MNVNLPLDYFVDKHLYLRLKTYCNDPESNITVQDTNYYKLFKCYYDFLNVNFEFLTNNPMNDIDNSNGFMLDIIGNNIGLARSGMLDSEYRRAIKLQDFALRSTTTLDYVYKYIKTFYEPNQCFLYNDGAKIIGFLNLKDTKIIDEFYKFENVIAAGVGFEIYYTINTQINYIGNSKKMLLKDDAMKLLENNSQILYVNVKELNQGVISKFSIFGMYLLDNNNKILLDNLNKTLLITDKRYLQYKVL